MKPYIVAYLVHKEPKTYGALVVFAATDDAVERAVHGALKAEYPHKFIEVSVKQYPIQGIIEMREYIKQQEKI